MNKDSTKTRNNLNWLMEQPIMVKMDLINHHLSLVQYFVNQIIDEEVRELAGDRYSHDESPYYRHGYNPGSVKSGVNKVAIQVPRLRHKDTDACKPLETYAEMRKNHPDQEELLQAVLKGLSTRDYESIADYLGESFGLSKSNVSRRFVEASKDKLEQFEQRSLADEKIIAIFVDGKHLYGEQMIIAMGVTESGEKKNLGLLQTSSENSTAIAQLFKKLIERGLQYDEGILFVIDGSKGIKKAIVDVFGKKALIQRCTWHKRENILAPLPENEKDKIKSKYHAALQMPTYKQAKVALFELLDELKKINRQSANSLEEGFEELLTLHKMEANVEFSISFNTTNCIESINSQINKYVGRVKNWQSSDQRYRWVATALVHIETKTRKVDNYKQLYKLKQKISTFVNHNP